MPKTEIKTKKFTYTLNIKRMEQIMSWFEKHKSAKYSSFTHFVRVAIENEYESNRNINFPDKS